MSHVTGFVVTGGESRRMGTDKALLEWNRTTLLDHAIARLRAVTDDVRLLTGRGERYVDRGLPVVRDLLPLGGSLVGVYSGVAALTGGLGLFLAVDLPNVTPAVLTGLLAAAPDFDAVVPASPAGPEPLCAVYGASCLDPMRRAIERGDLKMTSFWGDVRLRRLELREPPDLFLNLNDKTSYEAAREARS